MEKHSMQLYLGDLKNTRVHVTSRDPLSFTVNGCSGLQAYREQLFEQQFAALEYCAYLVQDREVHAGEIRILLAMYARTNRSALLWRIT